jgi:hypothetical protein
VTAVAILTNGSGTGGQQCAGPIALDLHDMDAGRVMELYHPQDLAEATKLAVYFAGWLSALDVIYDLNSNR